LHSISSVLLCVDFLERALGYRTNIVTTK
jgi:hypothetical protein